jgi:CyaY protein
MTETEYLRAVALVLQGIENALDRAPISVDCALAGLVLNIEFDDHAKIVVNAQAPTQQLWLAARSGGMHFSFDGTHWVDTRSGEEFYRALSRVVSDQLGQTIDLRPS